MDPRNILLSLTCDDEDFRELLGAVAASCSAAGAEDNPQDQADGQEGQ